MSLQNKQQLYFERFVQACKTLLHESPSAKATREYLDSRLAGEHQLKYEFGWFPSDDRLGELTGLVSKDDLEAINVYYPKFVSGGMIPHGHFSDHNLVMPFRDVHGSVVALLGRSLLTDDERSEILLQKYKYNTNCRKDLYVYGLDKAKDSIIEKDVVIGVEGQFDCIALHAAGIMNVVAFGWANISRYQMFQIHRYTNNIIIMFDNDEAGQRAKKRSKDKYKDINIKAISPPKGYKDIDEFLRCSNDKNMIKRVIDKLKGFQGMDG